MKLKLLRAFLLAAAFGWGISVFGIFMPWSWTVSQLQGLGAGNLPADPMLDYWLRMTAGAFTAIGIFFFLLAINPKRYGSIIPIAAVFLFTEGIILLVHGLRLNLDPLPFYVDVAFCIIIGSAIWLLRNEAL